MYYENFEDYDNSNERDNHNFNGDDALLSGNDIEDQDDFNVWRGLCK